MSKWTSSKKDLCVGQMVDNCSWDYRSHEAQRLAKMNNHTLSSLVKNAHAHVDVRGHAAKGATASSREAATV